VKPDYNGVMNLADLETPFFRRTVAQMERLLAGAPSLYLHPSKRWEYPWALRRARLAPGSRVLDGGCGASIFPLFLQQLRCRVAALDPQPPAPLDAIQYICGELQQLPFAAESFDAVFCISVIEHLPVDAMPRALHELARVLKPEGRLLLTTDFGRRRGEEMWYRGPGPTFRVDWNIFDQKSFEHLIGQADDLEMDGELELAVDWRRMRPLMRRFHGYPYTSLAAAFRKRQSR